MKLTKKEFEKILKDKVVSECGVTLDVASAEQIYRCMAMIVRQIMSDRQKQFQAKTLGEGKKQVYYLCMEFLMGRSLRTSLFNLGLNEVAEQVLADADIKIDTIYEQEPDAGLGNGGLGRLAACYLDGMATDCIPGTGYSILYEYGIFKQKIVDGWQQETADNWLPGGQVWIKSRHRRSALTARPSRPGRAVSTMSSTKTTTLSLLFPTICTLPVTARRAFPSCACGRPRHPALI